MTSRPSRIPSYTEDQPLDHLRVRDHTVKPSIGRKVLSFFALGSVQVDGLGGDVSKWQAEIDWVKAKAAGWAFVFIRGGWGTVPDSVFVQHWQGSKAVGLARGTYLYYRDEQDPEEQAEQLYALCITATGEAGELPPTLDLEEYGNLTLTPSKVKKCLARLQELFGKVPIIYTGKWVWQKYFVDEGDYLWAIIYPLWIAQYTIAGWVEDHLNKVKLYPPSLPAPWKFWEFWQFSASAPAIAYGVSGSVVDVNYAAPGVLAKYGILPNPIPPPANGDEVKQAKCLLTQLNIRNKPAKTIDVGDILKNEIVSYYPADTVTLPGQEWLHVRKSDNTVGWAARIHPEFTGISLELLP